MTPFNREHIAVGAAGEGYGVCDNTGAVAYFDYADYGDSGNWGAPTLVSQTATSVKIARTTSDGVWTLTQNDYTDGRHPVRQGHHGAQEQHCCG